MKHSILGQAVNPRSHFLPTTPIITIGEQVPKENLSHSYFSYVVHHEYLHYEQFMAWPITLLSYAYQSMKLSSLFAKLHGFNLDYSGIASILKQAISCLPYGSHNWDDKKVAAEQNREFGIGLSALLEGGAILDCFLKPLENEIAQVGIDVVESLFRSRNLQLNRPHIIGTESCLAAIGLGNQEFRDPSLREHLALAANLPGLVVTRSMGRAIRESGLPEGVCGYEKVRDIIISKLPNVLVRYSERLDDGLRMIFTENKTSKWLTENIYFRDESIVGTHVIMNILHQAMRLVIPNDAPAFPIMASQSAVFNIIKLYEAMNRQTLTKCGIPFIRPEFQPVPAIFFHSHALTGIQIEIEDEVQRKSRLHFTGNQMNATQRTGWLTWCHLIILRAIGDSIEQKRNYIVCPFRQWVEHRYRDINLFDEIVVTKHLSEMCNGSLRVTFREENIGDVVVPSRQYCKCSTSRAPDKIGCLFQSVVMETLYPSLTVAELYTKIKNSDQSQPKH